MTVPRLAGRVAAVRWPGFLPWRLPARYKAMTARDKPAGVAVTAMARELAGSAGAEMTSS